MGKYLKVEAAHECRAIIHKRVEKYFIDKEKIQINSGQLKFLDGLMIRHLAISSNVKIQNPRKKIFHYLDTMILSDNDEVITFLDNDKNMESFFQSPYGKTFPFTSTFKTDYGTIPFLLLQKAQDAMESSLNYYMTLKNSDEEDDSKKGTKESAYLDLLIGIVLYEIFLRELFHTIETITPPITQVRRDLAQSEFVDQLWEKISNCKDPEQINTLYTELYEQTQQYYEQICHASFSIYYNFYFVMHLTNFYAILRIVFLMEFVNINIGNYNTKSEESRKNLIEAKFWTDQVAEFKEKKVLFGNFEKRRNLGNLYNELNSIYKEHEIFPYVGGGRSYSTFEADALPVATAIADYLAIIGKHTAESRTFEEEESLWTQADSLSRPIWNAINSIIELQENAEAAHKQKSYKTKKDQTINRKDEE